MHGFGCDFMSPGVLNACQIFCKSLFFTQNVHIKTLKLTISVNFKMKFMAKNRHFLSRYGVLKFVSTIFCKLKKSPFFLCEKYLIFCLPFKNRIRIITS